MGLRRSRSLTIAPGLKSNISRTAASILDLSTFSVPKVSTIIETGCATPIAYATSISILSATPEATRFLATYLAA